MKKTNGKMLFEKLGKINAIFVIQCENNSDNEAPSALGGVTGPG